MPLGFFIEEFFNVAEQFNPLQLLDEEIGIFSAVLLMCPGTSFFQAFFYDHIPCIKAHNVSVISRKLRPPHCTTPAAVKANKNQKCVPSRAMKTFIRKKMGHTT